LKYKFAMMKKSIILTSFLTFLLFAGCSNDWLNNLEPQGKLLEVNYYSTPDQALTGLIGVYNAVKDNYVNGVWASYYLMASLPSDDAVTVGGGPTDRPEFHSYDEYTCTPITSGLLQQWVRCYYAIYRANVIITRTASMSDPGVLKIQAECKAIRAWMYFDLVRNFGQVPLITTELTPEEYLQPKATEAAIYAQIVQDLQEAIIGLKPVTSTDAKWRLTSYAAEGLLGKVYMFMASPYYNLGTSNYDLAATALKDVIDNGPYSLLSDYSQIWMWNNEFNAESLIEISYGPSPATATYWGNGSESQSNIIQQLDGPRGIDVNPTINPGWGFDMVTQDLVNAYKAEADSVRLHGTVLAEWQLKQITICDTCTPVTYITSFERHEGYTSFYTIKRTTWRAENPSAGVWSYPNNERILRLADIYLLYAEALNRKSAPDDGTALSYVNLVRARASLPALTGLTGVDLYKAIKHERRLELAQEGHRFYDLVRWEGDSDAAKGDDAKSALVPLGFVLGKHEHYPLPQQEINNSDGVLVQNPAYLQ
jgi:starch-binding outer membrane protein, SusD/RagB family